MRATLILPEGFPDALDRYIISLGGRREDVERLSEERRLAAIARRVKNRAHPSQSHADRETRALFGAA